MDTSAEIGTGTSGDEGSTSMGVDGGGFDSTPMSTTGEDPPDSTDAGTTDAGTTDDAGSSESTGSSGGEEGPVRVRTGLAAVYDFTVVGTTTVFDQSDLAPPLDLELLGSGHSWTEEGLRLGPDGIVRSSGSTTKIRTACQATNELSLEAWVTPATPELSGPARVITLSASTVTRNFTLGQGLNDAPGWSTRLRTTTTNTQGEPQLNAPMTVATSVTHVVYTRSSNGDERLYIDAVPVVNGTRGGDFSNWDSAMSFAIGNEFSLDRRFDGTLHLAAVYCRALTETEVGQNYDAGY